MAEFNGIIPLLVYADIPAAHDFLVRAFGFESGGVERTGDCVAIHAQSPVQRSVSAAPTGAQLATAFDGKLQPLRASPLYLLASMLVFVAMVLLPFVYFAIIAGAAAGVWWYAVHATVMFRHVPGGR